MEEKMKKYLFIFIVMCITTFQLQATTVDTDSNGFIVGISGVSISGGLWNARFIDDGPSVNPTVYDFDFSNNATNALFDLLASELDGQNIDTLFNPTNGNSIGPIFGCPSRSECFMATINTVFSNDLIAGRTVQNFAATTADLNNSASFDTTVNFTNATFIEWTEVAQVPIPAAAFMFAPALLGFLGLRRRAKNTVA